MPDRDLVFLLLAVVTILLATNRVRFDIVALMAVVALILTGVLSPEEALAGFGDPVVILVAGLLVVGGMLERTGISKWIARLVLSAGGASETRLMIWVMTLAAVLGSVMSSTAVVAIFIPIVMSAAGKARIRPSRLLMPMSYATLISGMLTLIATPPNLVISESLLAAGHRPLGFFSFAPIGLVILVAAIVYMNWIGRRGLTGRDDASGAASGERTIGELWEMFELQDHVASFRIGSGSALLHATLREAKVSSQFGVRVLGIRRPDRLGRWRSVSSGLGDITMQAGDVLWLFGKDQAIQDFARKFELVRETLPLQEQEHDLQDVGAAVLLVHPECRYSGKTVRKAALRSRLGVHVVAIRRKRDLLLDYRDRPIAPGDQLLVIGLWHRILQLRDDREDFILLELPAELQEYKPAREQAPLALALLAGMIVLSILNVVPIVVAVLLTGLVAVLLRILTIEDAYRSIHWSSIVLLAGMLPFATALRKTGGIQLVVDWLASGAAASHPYAMMTALFFITAGLNLFLSNTTTAVLMAPVAILSAQAMNVSPYPFAIMVLLSASAAFVTPFSSPVVTLVVQPGGYRFVDFVKTGLPLLLLTYVISMLLAPVIFPL